MVRALVATVAVLALAAPAQGYIPNDPGTGHGWQADQWNFLPGTGVDAPRAWDHVIAAGHPGGQGVRIAVLDTGVAYANRGRFRRSPDLSVARFVRGYDFCARTGPVGNACIGEDPYPEDENGHGTHVTSTIAEATGNGVGETGLAYGATIIPVKVLNRNGDGDEQSIAAGIRYAADRGAQIINLSFEYGGAIASAAQIPEITRAIRYARGKGALIVAAAGNLAGPTVGYPAALRGVLSVGAVTEHGCVADYSNTGADVVAPGGGGDAELPGQPNCRPQDAPGRSILQMTYAGSTHAFGISRGFTGTSMAAPHVSATAALVIASGVLGPHPAPAAIIQRLKATARDMGTPGPDPLYGYGMIDAGRATTRGA